MTGDELQRIRKALDLSKAEFGAELGYQGSDHNRANRVNRYEKGDELVPPWIARLATLIYWHNLANPDHLPEWPDWPAYKPGGVWQMAEHARSGGKK